MITRYCNERCAKCGIWKNPEPDKEHLKIGAFIDCLKTLHHNLYQVTLTGGEPLLFIEDVLLIAEESAKHNVPMIIVTNGVLVTEDFLKKYAELGHILVFSIDTLEKEKWKDFRGTDTYDKVMNNIYLAHKLLGKKLRIQSVYAEETKNDIPKIKEFCKKMNIQQVSQPYMDFGGMWNGVKQTPEKKDEIICAARKNICIYPNGDVVKCFDHYRIPLAKEPLGNIKKENIIEILCKKRATEISKIMKTCNFPCKYLSCNIPKIVYDI
jgi:radical SAM protein with 4Fe4S-binding SPASM domain